MNKTALTASIAAVLGTVSMGAQAELGTSAILEFTAGQVSCVFNIGTPPNGCTYGAKINTTGAGSYFGMDTNGDGEVTKFERTAIAMHDGVHIGTVQTASGSHSGAPFGAPGYSGTNFVQMDQTSMGAPIYVSAADPSGADGGTQNTTAAYVASTTEAPGVDEPWNFFGNTGMHYLNSAATVLSGAGTNSQTLDFSGWGVTWNGIPAITMASGAHSGGTDGVATITCGDASCSQSSTFALDYYATVPLGDPSGFGGVMYALHLEGHVGGTVSAVPVPAAVWLFGSGLLGLVGVARRKKA